MGWKDFCLDGACGLAWAGALVGCVGVDESALRSELSRAAGAAAQPASPVAAPPSPAPPSPAPLARLPSRAVASAEREPMPAARAGLPRYLRLALEHHPDIQAAFARWEASVHRISRARRLPEPTLQFAVFARSVETRVGPQRARLSLQQAFPWPTRLLAGADAAAAEARALQRRFEAEALSVAERVETAYWDLWQIRAQRAILDAQRAVVRALSSSVRARLSTGAATLADLQQLDLAAARLDDDLRGLEEAERGAEARLRAAIGGGGDAPLPTPDEPGGEALPSASLDTLRAAARGHPRIEDLRWRAEASRATARAAAAERFPGLTVGADWILTGEATAPGVEGSGRDALVIGAGLRLPLWQGDYADGIAAAEAEARAHRADRRSLVERTDAALVATLAQLRDAARRVTLHRSTLVPQAETAYASVLGAYSVGRATVAQALLSQRELLELRVALEQARADHARTWARLEAWVGREVAPAAGAPAADAPAADATPSAGVPE